MLYLVATPIGNLGDLSVRAVETLQACDYILCEDTRHSQTLLQHYHLSKPLKSHHKFNEASQLDSIIADLERGLNIALISDAGTPCIADPGERLVQKCIECNIPLTAIPGPCAAIQALCCSGLSTEKFQFIGFLPKKEKELYNILYEILNYPGTTICYESPHRLLDTLQIIQRIAPSRHLVVARELTKKFEELKRGSAEELIKYWSEHNVKGEIVLLISGCSEKTNLWEQLTPLDHVRFLQDTYLLSKTEAIKIAAEQRGIPKRQLYNDTIDKGY